MPGRWSRQSLLIALLVGGLSVGLASGPADAQEQVPPTDPAGAAGTLALEFHARLHGFEETPAISTRAQGQFRALVTPSAIHFTLTYSNLEAPVTAAHIHLAQRDVAGGIIAFLCGGGGKPACPQSGTVTGTITPADIIGPATQGIAPGEFREVIRAMLAGVTYANVHSQMFPAGEIRGQLRRGGLVSAPNDRDVE